MGGRGQGPPHDRPSPEAELLSPGVGQGADHAGGAGGSPRTATPPVKHLFCSNAKKGLTLAKCLLYNTRRFPIGGLAQLVEQRNHNPRVGGS